MDTSRVLDRLRRELHFDFIRASGPGGQNVNKVASAVQLRFDLRHSPSLGDPVKKRLRHLAGRRITAAGILVIEARQHRTQDQNRNEALGRFDALILKSLQQPRARRETRPTGASKERRLKSKKQRAEVKRLRRRDVVD